MTRILIHFLFIFIQVKRKKKLNVSYNIVLYHKQILRQEHSRVRFQYQQYFFIKHILQYTSMPLHSSIRINRDKKNIELCQVTCFGILVVLLLLVVATDAHLDTICTEDDTKWDQLLAPASMGIAVMSQLLVSSSVARDFAINKTDKVNIPLLKHPESFRTTLVQIVNESYEAFMLAHTNMEKIQLQVGQVPDYVKECDKIIKTNNKAAIDKFVPRRLEIIKKAANDGEKLSKEVSDAFGRLGKLIGQVLFAISASQGEKEKEIKATVQKQIEEDKKRQIQNKEREKAFIEKEKENAMALLKLGQEILLEERKRSRGILELIFNSGKKTETIEHIQITVKEAEKRLEKAKLEAEQIGEEIDKICNDCIKSLDYMHVDVDEKISTDEMIQLLEKGTKQLGELQKNWAGMTTYFTSINSYIEKVMKPQQEVFIDDANAVLELESCSVDVLTNSMVKSLESSIKSIKEVQDELIKSYKNANEGITSNCQQGPYTYVITRFIPFLKTLLPPCDTVTYIFP